MEAYTLVSQDVNAFEFASQEGRLRIQVLEDGLLRISATTREHFVLRNEPMVINADSAGVSWTLTKEDGGGYKLVTSALCVRISPTGVLRYETAGGHLLTTEPKQNGRILREIDIVRYHYDPGAPTETIYGADGVRQRAKGTPYADRKGFQTRLSFVFSPDEAIYGLGQHEEGVLNYRGRHQYLYQHNLKIACPVLMSSRGWGLLYNSLSAMTFHDDHRGSYLSSDADEEMDFFFLYGPEFDDMVAQIRRLTGDAAMLPKWALGYIQSKERYCDQEELLDIAREYRRRGLPLDVVVQDWQTWEPGLWGQKTVDKTRYPDLKACIDELHSMDVKLMISIWPHMQGDGSDRREFLDRGMMLGNRSTYDAFSEEARRLYWRQTNDEFYSQGMDAWWCDCSEPFEADWNGKEAMTAEDRMQVNVSEAKAYLDPTMINVYSLWHCKGIWDGQRGEMGGKRVFNITRSGFPGQQRYGAVVWNGDVSATWETLRRSLPDGLNFCLSGQPYWHFDVGGFFSGAWENHWFAKGEYEDGCNDPAYRELYLRWFQLGAFTPIFRSHGTGTPRELWRFGEEGEEIYDALADTLRLRMAFLPYLYSLCAGATQNRSTLLRMLAFDFRDDPRVHNIGDQYMLGRCLMVCPVLSPGAEQRDVVLPCGKDWYSYHTNLRYAGGQTITVPTPLQQIPLFVPAGSILPMGPPRLHAADLPDAPVTLRVYPGADGEFVYYEDEGDGYGYEQGAFTQYTLRWHDRTHTLTVKREGDYPQRPDNRRFVVCLPSGLERVFDMGREEVSAEVCVG